MSESHPAASHLGRSFAPASRASCGPPSSRICCWSSPSSSANAILHGTGAVRLRVDVGDDGRVRGEVVDQGSGFARELDRRGVDDVGGRGLRIVGSLAERWGVHEGTSHVWFELGGAGDVEPVEPRLGVDERPDQLD